MNTQNLNHVLSKKIIYKHTPPNILKKLKIKLTVSKQKGIGLKSIKPIKKGNIIAYYKLKVYNSKTKQIPTQDKYEFILYSKKGFPLKKIIGDISTESIPLPKYNIPFWAHLANEPDNSEVANSYIDINLKSTYLHRSQLKEGDFVIYKLIATRNIKINEPILWCYGDQYIRTYSTSCVT